MSRCTHDHPMKGNEATVTQQHMFEKGQFAFSSETLSFDCMKRWMTEQLLKSDAMLTNGVSAAAVCALDYRSRIQHNLT